MPVKRTKVEKASTKTPISKEKSQDKANTNVKVESTNKKALTKSPTPKASAKAKVIEKPKTEEEIFEEIKGYEEKIKHDMKAINDILILIKYLDDPRASVVFQSLRSLERTFGTLAHNRLLRLGNVDPKHVSAGAGARVKEWLRTQFDVFRDKLVKLIENKDLQLPVLDVVSRLSQRGEEYMPSLQQLLIGLMKHSLTPGVAQYLHDKTFSGAKERNEVVKLIKAHPAAPGVLSVLSAVPTEFTEEEEETKRIYGECWEEMSKQGLKGNNLTTYLSCLPTKILPYHPHPLSLMDLLQEVLEDKKRSGTANTIYALRGVFELMTKYRLSYPSFYTRLYNILTPQLLMSRQRDLFFPLLETFLLSMYLPIRIVASFIKKLLRLSLTAPPPSAILCIEMCYRILYSHQQSQLLLSSKHISMTRRERRGDLIGIDPFDLSCTDPELARGDESTAWERDILLHHYCPLVAVAAKRLRLPLTRLPEPLTKYTGLTYASLEEGEASRRPRAGVALEYRERVNFLPGFAVETKEIKETLDNDVEMMAEKLGRERREKEREEEKAKEKAVPESGKKRKRDDVDSESGSENDSPEDFKNESDEDESESIEGVEYDDEPSEEENEEEEDDDENENENSKEDNNENENDENEK